MFWVLFLLVVVVVVVLSEVELALGADLVPVLIWFDFAVVCCGFVFDGSLCFISILMSVLLSGTLLSDRTVALLCCFFCFVSFHALLYWSCLSF